MFDGKDFASAIVGSLADHRCGGGQKNRTFPTNGSFRIYDSMEL